MQFVLTLPSLSMDLPQNDFRDLAYVIGDQEPQIRRLPITENESCVLTGQDGDVLSGFLMDRFRSLDFRFKLSGSGPIELALENGIGLRVLETAE